MERSTRAWAGLALALFSSLALIAVDVPEKAQAKDNIEQAGNILKVAMPLGAGAIALLGGDREGFAELGVSYVLTMGTAYALKSVIHEERPDHSDKKSFPSDSAASAFAAASYLDKRYGWHYGLPAYALAAFTGYSRVEADKHHWYDVVAGAAIGWGFNQLITTNYDLGGAEVHPLFATNYVGLDLDLKW